jgi:hypothetical protein
MKAAIGIVLCTALVGVGLPAAAQETVWRDLVLETNALLQADKLPEAEAAARRALAAAQQAFGPNHTRVSETAYLLMQTLALQGKPTAEIDALLRKIQEIGAAVIETRRQTLAMAWTKGPPERQWPDATQVVFTLPDFPGYSEQIFSTDLAPYLETLGAGPVPVTFELKYDTSVQRIVGRRIVKIGEREQWQSYFAATAVADPGVKTPWDQPSVP